MVTKKAESSTLLVTALMLSVIAQTLLIPSVRANFVPPPPPIIEIQSPTSYMAVSDVPLVVIAKVSAMGSFGVFDGVKWLYYSLDQQIGIPLRLDLQEENETRTTVYPTHIKEYNIYVARSTLRGLSDGQHDVTVEGESDSGMPLNVNARFVVDTVQPNLEVLSPIPEKPYFSTNVTLEYTVDEPVSWAGYSLDGNANVTSTTNATLNLTYGTHVIRVYVTDAAGNFRSSPDILFTVKDIAPPTISILTAGTEYNTTDIPLDFTVNEDVLWIGYSLDAQANVTITGNTTITGVSPGFHNPRIYANDTAGNIGFSQTLNFSIPNPLLTAFIAAASTITLAMVGVGLLVYIRRQKRLNPK